MTKIKRRWHQFHLSTAIALMFAGGICVGILVARRQGQAVPVMIALDNEEACIPAATPTPTEYYTARGWPFQYRERYEGPTVLVAAEQYVRQTEGGDATGDIRVAPLLADVGLALAALFLCGTLIEFLNASRDFPATLQVAEQFDATGPGARPFSPAPG